MAAVDPEQPDPLKLGYLPTQDHSAAATARTELGLKAKASAEQPGPPAASPGSDAAALLPTRDYGPQPGAVTPPSKDAAAPAGTATEDPAPPSLIGQRVGQYRVLRELGRGGMGVVYETLHDGISQRAALKTLHPELSRNPQFKKRFLNEARATSLAKHPGLVKVFDSGQLHDGTLYILMEFLDGESLAKRLGDDDNHSDSDPHQRMPEVMALRLCRQMASALSAVHAEGIAHRDLKPANVLIVKDPEAPAGERVKILDFGLAKLRADAQRIGPGDTNTSAIMGTPAYMAPEQCRSLQQADGKSDVYSLGVMLFEMLAGRKPFLADTAGDLIALHITQAPPDLHDLAPTVSAHTVELVAQMLHKNPAARPAMSVVEQRLTEAEQHSLAGTARPPQRRSKLGVPVAAGLLIASALVGTGVWTWQQLRPRSQVSSGTLHKAPSDVAVPREPVSSNTLQLPTKPALPLPPQPSIAEAATVLWTLRTQPAGALVVRTADRVPLGNTPLSQKQPLGAGLLPVTVELPGYVPTQLQLPLERSLELDVVLEPLPKKGKQTRGGHARAGSRHATTGETSKTPGADAAGTSSKATSAVVAPSPQPPAPAKTVPTAAPSPSEKDDDVAIPAVH